jgi:hypothetical protein
MKAIVVCTAAGVEQDIPREHFRPCENFRISSGILTKMDRADQETSCKLDYQFCLGFTMPSCTI